MKHLEIVAIEHKGISVVVKIDYDLKEISFVEKQKNSQPSVWGPKQWIFKGRGVEYMNGWVDIMEAMIFATKQAKKLLDDHIKAEEKRHAELIIMLQKEEAKNKK